MGIRIRSIHFDATKALEQFIQKKVNKLEVFYHERLVGTIALYQNRLAAFEYDSNWLANGFSISPFSLPLEKKVFYLKTY